MGDCLLQFWIAVLAAWTLVGRPGDVMLLKFEIPVLVEVEGRHKKDVHLTVRLIVKVDPAPPPTPTPNHPVHL